MPSPAADRRAMALAAACVLLGVLVLAAALLSVRGEPSRAAEPPGLPAAAPLPVPGERPAPVRAARREVAREARRGDVRGFARVAWNRVFARNGRAHVPAAWVATFYPLYERAQEAFGVNWLLLASVHRQETGFSTARGTYRGLNFARCCAGPMQFNVTNGPPTTWSLVRNAYKRAERPAGYPNRTRRHPSVYDDFDAIMAGARLLAMSGAGARLDASAWRAAFDYYGHDLTGVDYASRVVARAIGWSQKGFSINQPDDPALVAAVDAAWGAPVREGMLSADERRERRRAAAARRARAASR